MAGVVRPPIEDLVAQYERFIGRSPVSEATVRSYVFGVRTFVGWVGAQTKHDYVEVLTDEVVATHAVRDFRRHLLVERKLAPKSVDSAITGVGSMFGWLAMPRPDVRSAAPRRRGEPKSLDEDQIRGVLRAAERRGVRDHALINLLYASGLRVSELAALDVDDLPLSERRGLVIVRAGKGDKPRDVPLTIPSALRTMNRWVRVRRDEYGLPEGSGPLFVTRTNDRLAIRSIRHAVVCAGESAGVGLTPHTLRHTFARNLIDQGVDVATVADLLGHSSLDTTMGYVQSRASHREAAVSRLSIDY